MVFSIFFYFFENKRNCLFFLKIYGFLSRFITFFSRLSFYNNIGKGKSPPSFLLLAVRQSFSRRLTPFWSELFPESPIQSEEEELCIPTRQQRFVDEMIESPIWSLFDFGTRFHHSLSLTWFYIIRFFNSLLQILNRMILELLPFIHKTHLERTAFSVRSFYGQKNSDRNFPPVAVFFFILWFSFDCLLADSPYGNPFRSSFFRYRSSGAPCLATVPSERTTILSAPAMLRIQCTMTNTVLFWINLDSTVWIKVLFSNTSQSAIYNTHKSHPVVTPAVFTIFHKDTDRTPFSKNSVFATSCRENFLYFSKK